MKRHLLITCPLKKFTCLSSSTRGSINEGKKHLHKATLCQTEQKPFTPPHVQGRHPTLLAQVMKAQPHAGRSCGQTRRNNLCQINQGRGGVLAETPRWAANLVLPEGEEEAPWQAAPCCKAPQQTWAGRAGKCIASPAAVTACKMEAPAFIWFTRSVLRFD